MRTNQRSSWNLANFSLWQDKSLKWKILLQNILFTKPLSGDAFLRCEVASSHYGFLVNPNTILSMCIHIWWLVHNGTGWSNIHSVSQEQGMRDRILDNKYPWRRWYDQGSTIFVVWNYPMLCRLLTKFHSFCASLKNEKFKTLCVFSVHTWLIAPSLFDNSLKKVNVAFNYLFCSAWWLVLFFIIWWNQWIYQNFKFVLNES